jgi:penicillin V acylase-like amidase (Ntn superfamily)
MPFGCDAASGHLPSKEIRVARADVGERLKSNIIKSIVMRHTHQKQAARCSFALGLMPLLLLASLAEACTRVVYLGPGNNIITARSMDWKKDLATNLWILPRGMARTGETGPNSIKWTSKYGSVVATGYDITTTDGVNEAGLMANLLWLVESEYPKFDQTKPGLTIAAWAQYVLDNFATVGEAVNALSDEPFTIVTDYVPGDPTGDPAFVHVRRDWR